MSDGNFNRALLPKNELSAGIRAGKAQMRAKAEKALKELLEKHFGQLSDDERERLLEEFMEKLRT